MNRISDNVVNNQTQKVNLRIKCCFLTSTLIWGKFRMSWTQWKIDASFLPCIIWVVV